MILSGWVVGMVFGVIGPMAGNNNQKLLKMFTLSMKIKPVSSGLAVRMVSGVMRRMIGNNNR